MVLEEMDCCYRVRIGRGYQLYPLPVDLDLNDKTSVSDLLDLGSICDGAVGQCSYIIPLAELFDKRLMIVWASKGLASQDMIIKTVTPEKILSKQTSQYVIDDWDDFDIRHHAYEFCNA